MKLRQVFLFSIIAIEGYVVLATELLAIRQLVPFVGSGIEIISIIISAVLLPLAIGYHAGGRQARRMLLKARSRGGKSISVRFILARNLVLAMCVLVLGLSYLSLTLFFGLLDSIGWHQRILQAAIYAVIFLVTPVFLMAQTVPLVSNYFSRENLSEITGKMLFFSTTGSFFGSVVSTIVLMSFAGVHYTVIFTLSLIAFLVILISRDHLGKYPIIAMLLVLLTVFLNSGAAMQGMHIVADTPYSTISIQSLKDGEKGKMLSINRSYSSKFSPDPEKRFAYVQYIEKHFIKVGASATPQNILVLGAGGFVTGWDDTYNHYTFVDIDPALRPVAEHDFLPHRLSPNKQSVTTSARAFLRRTTEHYDLIVVDLYTNIGSIPMESITREFLLDAKRALAKDGIIAANIVSSPDFKDKFSVRYYRTFASVFDVFDRQVIGDFNAYDAQASTNNTLYIYYNNELMQDHSLYTDDKNTYSLDH